MKELLLSRTDHHVATLTIHRPEKMNSLTPTLLLEIHKIMEEISADDDIRAIILRGAGDNAFCAGYDITELPTRISPDQTDTLWEESPLTLAVGSMVNYPYPIIAMLNGHAFGGGLELAANCDLRIAANDIRIGLPPAKLGIVYPLEGIIRFVQTIGFPKTKELLFTGRSFDAQRGVEMGLIDYIFPRDRLESFVYELADEMAANAPLSIKGTKRILNLLTRGFPLAEKDVAEAEALILEAFRSEDLKEGQAAFVEKRDPVFQGR
jgi:enoyl-CoA hydratase